MLPHRTSWDLLESEQPKTPIGKEVLDEVLTAIQGVKEAYRSRTDDVYHIASQILSLDVVPVALREHEHTIRCSSKMKKLIPTKKLLKKTIDQDGKQVYTFLQSPANLDIHHLSEFEEWLRKEHPENIDANIAQQHMTAFEMAGKQVSLPRRMPIITQETWRRYAQYYNSFQTEKLREEANRSVLSVAQYSIFIEKVSPGKRVKSIIEKYLDSQKTEFEKALKRLTKQ